MIKILKINYPEYIINLKKKCANSKVTNYVKLKNLTL